MCRQFEVSYDENVAHRADYDAKVLNDAWQAMLVLLTKENIHLRHEELSLLQNEKILKGLRPKHITVFAKNAQGLKDLFKLNTYLLDNKLNITHFEKDTKTNIAKNILEKVFE